MQISLDKWSILVQMALYDPELSGGHSADFEAQTLDEDGPLVETYLLRSCMRRVGNVRWDIRNH